MTTKVERFFHLRTPYSTHGGATVRVQGILEYPGQVDIQFTSCSRKDQFVKAIGRAEAKKAPIKVVPLRFLPQELAKIGQKQGVFGDFAYSLKYFLPKE